MILRNFSRRNLEAFFRYAQGTCWQTIRYMPAKAVTGSKRRSGYRKGTGLLGIVAGTAAGGEAVGTFRAGAKIMRNQRRFSGKEDFRMLELNYRDAKPIYEQIKDGLRRLILSGIIRQDEKLPSVRELASQLAINPNTIQKAYRELEQEGFSYTISGRGSFAAPLSDVSAGRLSELMNKFDEIVTELLYLKKEPEELKQRIDILKQGGGQE